jgi:hypothetical protein
MLLTQPCALYPSTIQQLSTAAGKSSLFTSHMNTLIFPYISLLTSHMNTLIFPYISLLTSHMNTLIFPYICTDSKVNVRSSDASNYCKVYTDAEASAKIKSLALHLNLREHRVSDDSIAIWTPVDLEAHLGLVYPSFMSYMSLSIITDG